MVLIEEENYYYIEGESPDMTVTLTTCTTFNTGPQVINSHGVLKHLTLPPLGRNNGREGNDSLIKATSTFPSKNVGFRNEGKQLLPLTTFSCDQEETGYVGQQTPSKPLGGN
jgi:hypothetical protein